MSQVQFWFKLSGQNEQNLIFQTRFSQIGLRLHKKWTEQKMLKIDLADILDFAIHLKLIRSTSLSLNTEKSQFL